MPTYDYACSACDHAFELFQAMSEPKKKKCPACGKSSLVRLMGAGAGVIFKGSGFYETDYKRAASPAKDGAGDGTKDGAKDGKDGAKDGAKDGGAAKDGGPSSKAPDGGGAGSPGKAKPASRSKARKDAASPSGGGG